MGNNKIIKLFEKFRYKYDMWRVFRDFVEISAISLSNTIYTEDYEVREKRYLELIKGYSKDEISTMAEMLGLVAIELSSKKGDVLGDIYQALSVNNKSFGQFFTPYHVSYLMAEMTLSNVKETIAEKGCISICEPCVGAGSMVIAAADSLERQGYNPSEYMKVTAIDLDIVCTHMSYVQFCLLQIPAVVYNGNSLNHEVRSTWITPIYAQRFLMNKDGGEQNEC